MRRSDLVPLFSLPEYLSVIEDNYYKVVTIIITFVKLPQPLSYSIQDELIEWLLSLIDLGKGQLVLLSVTL